MKQLNATTMEQPLVNQSNIPLKKISISIVFALCTYLAMGILTEFDSVLQAIQSISIPLYAVLIGLSLTSYLTRFFRWLIFLRPIQPDISICNHALIYFAGFALTTTPGKVGETLRSLYLYPLGISYSNSLAAFFSERLLDVLAVSALAMLTIGAITSTENWLITVAFLFIALFFLVRSRKLTGLFMYQSKKKLSVLTSEFQSKVSHFLSNRSIFTAFPLSVFAWTCQGVSLVLIVDSFGFDASPFVIIGIYCLSILAGAASFIPGGIGATEAAIAFLLSGLGMDPAQAVAASIVSRLVTLWLAIAIGLLSLVIYTARQSRHVTEVIKNL
ncbi:MAG: hypothetical protein DIZ80_17460 [endosymbiont of Galathealinum brachiosum]|uniref:TIGR00374 family protein n=1 Tax=endosymbiont of Galathealinum brachiosum TaxID=2200906 RepID=A0A370D740_9GAMM|nr:MAG: hypothetical protein DIZ80_17460 [endosymbiont of Galathealinum brachiosum]